MEDYRLDQSGQEVQDILDNAVLQSELTAETERATEAEQTLQGNIDAEATRAQGAEGTLQDNIDAEETRAKAAEKQNSDDIDAIEEKIPSGASSSNKLATEEYVADAVATATATFRGTYNLVSDLHLNVTATEQQISAALAGAISTADNNDYCFILVPTSLETPTEIKEIDRYKFNGTAWAFEYKLNNSGFTAAQWAAINSGITSGDVAKLAALPTNAQLTTLLAGLQSDIDGEETRAKGAEGTLQDNIDAEETRAKTAEKQNADDIDAIEAVIPESASSENKVATESEINSLSAAIEAILLLIPSAATSLNKLADKAFVNSSIATATATFRGTYNLVNDLGLTTSATHAQIATALAGAILTADNNDYAFVQIPTSDAMPTEIAKTERYKFNGTAWEYEYDLNNSGFTADQWAAINSGITQALVTKLSALPTNAELTTELGTLTSGINTINQKIPNAASQANKLVDTAAMESYIVQVLDVLTASFNVTSTDGHVTVQISQVDGKITSVAVSTSDIASAADLNLKASQADLTALASRVTTAEGNITTLGGRITTAEGNITSLGGRMTTAEGNITTINGIITSLGGRVSTNETDIANLQELYNSLQQSKPVPVDALPETGQQQGVIYRLSGTTSYSDYMWNGSTWVLMATYNNAIDPRPKKASQNLVTSGGVFDNMGALDVSELNATENPHTLAQYVDLSAALAAIPTDYQKGGMSIKFIQSYDNKYVQYRLMSNTFTTIVSEWQNQGTEETEAIARQTIGQSISSEATIVAGTSNVHRLYTGFIPAGTEVKVTLLSDVTADLIVITQQAQSATQTFYWDGVQANTPSSRTVITTIDVEQIELWTSSSIAVNGNIDIQIEISTTDCLKPQVASNAEDIERVEQQILDIMGNLPQKQESVFESFETHSQISYTQSTFNGWATRYSITEQLISSIDVWGNFNHATDASFAVTCEICKDDITVLATVTKNVDSLVSTQQVKFKFAQPILLSGNFFVRIYSDTGYIYTAKDSAQSAYCTADSSHQNKYRQVNSNWENLNNNPKSYSLDVVLYTPTVQNTNDERIIHVGEYNGADFAEIQDAINSIWIENQSEPYIIYVHPKSTPYKPFSMIRQSFSVTYPWSNSIPKNISIIGLNIKHCIVESDKGDYYYPAAELLANGTIKNIHFKLTDANHLSTSTEGGYAAHIDSRTLNDMGYNMLIADCVFESKTGPAVGIGLHSNVNLNFERCRFISDANPAYSPVEGYENLANWGCIFLHSSTVSTAENQNASFIDCIGNNKQGQNSLLLSFVSGGSADGEITLMRNVFWENTRAIPGYSIDSRLNYNPANYGNNIPT